MSKMRHWKQRFDASAELIFSRNMKLGIAGQEVVKRGDVVSIATKRKLGRSRLQRWWNAGFLELAVVTPEKKVVDPIEDIGGGWFQVTLADGSKRKIQGRSNAVLMVEAIAEQAKK